MNNTELPNYLNSLESEAIYAIREAAATCKNIALLYSIGKDSSVLLHLAKKAFAPSQIPFKVIHVDTGYKFPQMYDFRDKVINKYGLRNQVFKSSQKKSPDKDGIDLCCSFLKTQALIDVLTENNFDCSIGGARRDEEKSRAKELFFSVRDRYHQWDPRNQRPEFASLFNTELSEGQSFRVFPLSNWTEIDIWKYISHQNIDVVDLYFSKKRKVILKNDVLFPIEFMSKSTYENEVLFEADCRYRSLGCTPCTGAVRSKANTIDLIVEELINSKSSERQSRAIDKTSLSAMEEKKKKGYF